MLGKSYKDAMQTFKGLPACERHEQFSRKLVCQVFKGCSEMQSVLQLAVNQQTVSKLLSEQQQQHWHKSK